MLVVTKKADDGMPAQKKAKDLGQGCGDGKVSPPAGSMTKINSFAAAQVEGEMELPNIPAQACAVPDTDALSCCHWLQQAITTGAHAAQVVSCNQRHF